MEAFWGRRKRRRYDDSFHYLIDYIFDSDSDSFDAESDDSYFNNYNYPDTDALSSPQKRFKENSSEPKPEVPASAKSLIDLASRTVGKHYPCEILESCEPPLDESLLKKIAFWAFPQEENKVLYYASLAENSGDWIRGVNMVADKRVGDIWQVGFMLTAQISNPTLASSSTHNASVQVSVTFEREQIISATCSHCKRDVWCPHITASIVYRIRHPDKVKLYGPLMETLSSLDRNQLQKLLQYAVQLDPAGTLSKVYQHLDAIRDANSEMSVMAGAPDPTFGAAQGSQSQWQLSVERFQTNLKADLAKIYSLGSMGLSMSQINKYYPNSFDSKQKSNAKLHDYVQKALDLAKGGEVWSAAKIFVVIAECVFHTMDGHGFNSNLARFSHDLETVYTLCMLYCDQYPMVQQFLQEKAWEFNRNSASFTLFALDTSEWAEFPSLVKIRRSEVQQKALLKSKASHLGALFQEPLCVQDLPKPTELQNLLDGKVTPKESKYGEHIVIMLKRVQFMMAFRPGPGCNRLAMCILYKLANMARQESILGAFESSCPGHISVKQIQSILATNRENATPVRATMTRSSKGKSLRNGPRLKKTSSKNLRKAEEKHSPELSLSQLTYCMLYLCDAVYNADKSNQFDVIRHDLILITMLALELSRFRTVAPKGAITAAEHSHLQTMEMSVCNCLELKPNSAKEITELYLNALHCVGCQFYQGAFPLALLSTIMGLLFRQESELREKRQEDILQVCASFLLASTNPLEKFTITSYSSSNSVFEGFEYVATGRHPQEYAVRKFHAIAEMFFSVVETSKDKHSKLLSQVLTHLEKVQDALLLQMICKDLALRIHKLEQPVHMESCLRLIIHTIKKSKGAGFFRYKLDINFVYSLAKKLGPSSLKMFLSGWKDIFTCTELQKLLLSLKTHVEGRKTVPHDFVDLIFEYFEADSYHTHDATNLLDFFTPGDANYKKALEKITANAKNYLPATLFELAKKQVDLEKDNKGQALTPENFHLLELAMINLRSPGDFEFSGNLNARMLDHIDWIYKLSTLGNSKAKNSDFSRMIELMSSHGKKHPSIVLRVFQHLEKSPALLKHAGALGTSLVEAYKSHFDSRLQHCGHGNYRTVIQDMVKARLHCKQYVKNGEPKFDAQVLKSVITLHWGKKKLIRLMEQEFGELPK